MLPINNGCKNVWEFVAYNIPYNIQISHIKNMVQELLDFGGLSFA